MSPDPLQQQTATAALNYVQDIPIFGIGSGPIVNHFIDLLSNIKFDIEGVVSSSKSSTERIKKIGIPVLDLNAVGDIEVYVDGADEINQYKQMIKGGDGTLSGAKIIAAASKKFVCIVDESKMVDMLGSFPLPIEVIPMARSFVAREMVKLGGRPVWRENYVTENGNQMIDIHNLDIMQPIKLEKSLNDISGVVSVGLCALRPADVVLIGKKDGVMTF